MKWNLKWYNKILVQIFLNFVKLILRSDTFLLLLLSFLQLSTLRAFSVSCGFARMREIWRCGCYAISCFSFLQVAWQYWQSLVQYGAYAPPDSKMDTEVVVGTLTHADAPQRVTLYNKYTWNYSLRVLCMRANSACVSKSAWHLNAPTLYFPS
jgi:hypothetical protein